MFVTGLVVGFAAASAHAGNTAPHGLRHPFVAARAVQGMLLRCWPRPRWRCSRRLLTDARERGKAPGHIHRDRRMGGGAIG